MRKRIDLTTWPRWIQGVVAVAVVALVVGLAVRWQGNVTTGTVIAACAAALLAFGLVAWRSADRRR
ncbi:hypothetical protein [Lentzea flava]|uniref:MYXO-CTERM domain-containing protein n=1 Tax=Lentzea flava TaxID=103732 RepID=A0ABQ2UXE6_9PSEU|nr:hypothetical protein [Lentzea flava]MCP2202094.1 hypothetical protein [Lentzea flava]GGU56964.1 hypothetical protein GCM10010178_56670 [Lentzea flava]